MTCTIAGIVINTSAVLLLLNEICTTTVGPRSEWGHYSSSGVPLEERHWMLHCKVLTTCCRARDNWCINPSLFSRMFPLLITMCLYLYFFLSRKKEEEKGVHLIEEGNYLLLSFFLFGWDIKISKDVFGLFCKWKYSRCVFFCFYVSVFQFHSSIGTCSITLSQQIYAISIT